LQRGDVPRVELVFEKCGQVVDAAGGVVDECVVVAGCGIGVSVAVEAETCSIVRTKRDERISVFPAMYLWRQTVNLGTRAKREKTRCRILIGYNDAIVWDVMYVLFRNNFFGKCGTRK
jgi:hypothetical protein